METRRQRLLRLAAVLTLAACGPASLSAYAKDKKEAVGPNDPTYRLFQVLDTSYGARLANLYVIVDEYSDPSQPGQMLQHVLLVNYDKTRLFGRLNIHVRAVSQLTPEQAADYTAAQVYDFGSDIEKFDKTDPGPFGGSSDLYCQAVANRPLMRAEITDEARSRYEFFLTRYILPELNKK